MQDEVLLAPNGLSSTISVRDSNHHKGRKVSFRLWATTYGLSIAIVVAGVSIACSNAEQVGAYLLSTFPFGVWLLLRRNYNTFYLSPTMIVAGFFTAIGVLGYTFRDFLVTLHGRGTSAFINLTEAQSFETFALIMGASGIVLLTSGIVLILTSRSSGINSFDFIESHAWSAREPNSALIALAAVPLLAFIASTGPEQLLIRDSYLFVGQGNFVGSIGSIVLPAMIVALGYLFTASNSGKRLFTLLLFSGYALVLFSMGSRRFALIPALFALGMFLSKDTRITRLSVVLGSVLTLALMPLPLMFRSSDIHGIAPYLQVLSQVSPADADWSSVLNNILVSFPIIGATAFGGQRVQWSDLWVSLNPISGDSAGWYSIAPRLRLNPYTPTAGLGELANVGWLPFTVFFIFTGLVLAWIEITVRRHVSRGSRIFAALMLGMTALFAFQMAQYNLRSAFRSFVYMIAAEALRWLISMIILKKDSFSGKASLPESKDVASQTSLAD
jgi:hypothetical protein